jgi:elongation factor P--(R)-beta-lysine ligase
VDVPDHLRGLVRAGDHVRLRHAETAPFPLEAVEILTPYRRGVPFPSPGGEYHRLHSGPSPRAVALERRARGLSALRAFFDGRGYLEVQTPLLVRAPGLEPHLVALRAGDGYLITSPEYHMKRLLAGGLERIYSLGPSWRGDEEGPHHLCEFCMLEWYRAHASLEDLMAETEELLAHVALAVRGSTRVLRAGRALSFEAPFPRLTVAEVAREAAGVDLVGVVAAEALRARLEAAGLGPFADGEGFDALFSRLLVDRVEAALASHPSPVFLHDFPAPLAALSRLRPGDPTVAERFELYAAGVELANAFAELCDPDEQFHRLEGDLAARRRAGAPTPPIDDRFLEALREGIPPTSGIALGVDRLLMILCEARSVGEVVAFAPGEV